MSNKISFIGTGNMASAMIMGLVNSGKFNSEDIFASNRGKDKLNKLCEKTGITGVKDS